jgi:hypothetical protein
MAFPKPGGCHGFKILAANKSTFVIQCFQMSNSDVFVLLFIADMQII